ncbi:MAG: hypothetical protein EOO04_03545 [Chitinophagaceae bacterium]|nr:MAG: hypothetical protein EOO04_03545 [Chitinophagaceae bacterium]
MPQTSSASQLPAEQQLQIDEDIQLHHKGWKIQRFAWVLVTVFLVLALLGLFGTGPLSLQEITVSGDTARYESFMRYQSEARLSFHAQNVQDTLRISFPQNYRQYVDVKAIDPTPERNSVSHGVITYYFPANGAVTVHCTLMAVKTGKVSEIFVVNNHRFKINHLIYP